VNEMSGTRTAGGILGIIGGASILVSVLISISVLFSGSTVAELIAYILALTIGVLALVGGILSLATESSGGGLVLAAGIIAVACGVLYFFTSFPYVHIRFYAFLSDLFLANLATLGITVEGILIFVGGILAVVGKE